MGHQNAVDSQPALLSCHLPICGLLLAPAAAVVAQPRTPVCLQHSEASVQLSIAASPIICAHLAQQGSCGAAFC